MTTIFNDYLPLCENLNKTHTLITTQPQTRVSIFWHKNANHVALYFNHHGEGVPVSAVAAGGRIHTRENMHRRDASELLRGVWAMAVETFPTDESGVGVGSFPYHDHDICGP